MCSAKIVKSRCESILANTKFIKRFNEKELIINDFENYLKENGIDFKYCNDNIQEYIDNYILSIHYDLIDNLEDLEEIEKKELEIAEILENSLFLIKFYR